MIPPLIIPFLAAAVTFLYGSVLDLRDRRVPFKTWYPMIAVSLPFAAWTYYQLLISDMALFMLITSVILIFCCFMYAIAYFGLFGGADAWGLIFIALLIPIFPLEPLFGYPPLPVFAFSVLTNALILNLGIPLFLLLFNIIQGNKAPLLYKCIGFPVKAEDIRSVFGFVIEDIQETAEGISRRFIPFREAVGRMTRDDRIFTRDLRDYPEEYHKDLYLYSRAGSVWISYGVPFFIPITAGLILSCTVGDILFILMRAVLGMPV
ncbi:MAG: A24 family peptidase [Methanocalculus sp. MSAO_Arc1]|uniref:A24 family peptidase C-terminal domain-containing protein n=1 Tax=Methanocalculus TaxID=71151 RepID=UPI000FF11EA6|nr:MULTISPECIES: A24 family peptidase C-terminal domain-containing protein [unclassified Methanocalculus]MCP1662026.1 preflagellin peptidase FlaK [Methanocalculus sp. AMF5]RQD79608.1 MAG: A24 family peptidase [Methanocalculus sp. MSAO_Arc1]